MDETRISLEDGGPNPPTEAQKLQIRSAIGVIDPAQNNPSAVVPPTVTDDSAAGYSVGSLWVDAVGLKSYHCTDATQGAAVWIVSTLTAVEVADLIDTAVGTPTADAKAVLGGAATSGEQAAFRAQSGVVDPPQHNAAAGAAPAVTDDSNAGYAVGSLWVDTTADEAYRCVDASVGAAVWVETTTDATDVSALITASVGTPTAAAKAVLGGTATSGEKTTFKSQAGVVEATPGALVWELSQAGQREPRVGVELSGSAFSITSVGSKVIVGTGGASSTSSIPPSEVKVGTSSGPVLQKLKAHHTGDASNASGLSVAATAWFNGSHGSSANTVTSSTGVRKWLALNLFTKIMPGNFFVKAVGDASNTAVTNKSRVFTVPASGSYLLKFQVPARSGTPCPVFDLLVKDASNASDYSLLEIGALDAPRLRVAGDEGSRVYSYVLNMTSGQTLTLILRAWRGGHAQTVGVFTRGVGSNNIPGANINALGGYNIQFQSSRSSRNDAQLQWDSDKPTVQNAAQQPGVEARQFFLQLYKLA